MAREQLRLVLRDLGESAFERGRDPAVQRAAGFPQQRAVGGVLDERVLEEIGRMVRRPAAKEQTRLDETVQEPQACFALARDGRQKGVRNSRPIAAPVCAMAFASPSRSSRAISDA